MGRKKQIPNLDEYELGYIEGLMKGQRTFKTEEADTVQLKKHMFKVDLKCKNKKQKEFLQMLKDPKNQICFGIGSAGSGKSYLSLGFALSQLKDTSTPYEKIIIMIPSLQSCSKELNIGLLPGDMHEKTQAWRVPDQLSMEKILKHSNNANPKFIIEELERNKYIDYQLVNFVRGITYENAIILINEAEGYDKDELLLLLTRLGENCKCIVTGDEKQKSRRDMKNGSGTKYAIEKLGDMEEVGVTTFEDDDIVRNPLISKILERWD